MNSGKSTLLNFIVGQEIAITSPVPGTTTDVVEKTLEMLPLGPLVLLDTAGLDDASILGEKRAAKTRAAFERIDVAVLVAEMGLWGDPEETVVAAARERGTPLIGVATKTDLRPTDPEFMARMKEKTGQPPLSVSCVDPRGRDAFLSEWKERLIAVCPEEFVSPPPIVGDLLPSGGLAVLVVPIDLGAPKGRLILPQVQTVRDALDHDAATLLVKEREYGALLGRLARPPDLVICDSQVVLKAAADTPTTVPLTTFSILFARAKGDLVEMARGAAALNRLKPGNRVLVAEACSHHASEDDIGRVKIPRWLTRHVGGELQIDVRSGHDYPDNIADYALVLHCGGCMITRREMLGRLQRARRAGVPVTNYGVAISTLHGVAERVLAPFPAALAAYRGER